MPAISIAGHRMLFSSPAPTDVLLPCAPFTHSFVKCCCNAEFPTRGGARAPGFTIIVTYSPSIPYAVGIETVRISKPNFLFWQHIWGINTFLELSVTFISPPRSFPKSPHELRRLLVRSFPGELIDEAHRFFHSCDQFLNASLGRTAESQSKYDQGIPRRVYAVSAILP